MADGFIQVEPDSTGKKAQTFQNTILTQDVHAEAVVIVDENGIPALIQDQGADIANATGVLVQGSVSTLDPTYSDSTISPLSIDTSGRLRIVSPGSVTVTGTVAATQSGTWNVKSPNASNFLSTISGTVSANQSNYSNFLASIVGTVTANQSNASNLLVTATIPSLPANSSFNLNQILSTTVDVNSGTKSAGTQRVVIATDQPQLTNKLLVTPDANSAFNLSQVVGTTADVNSGTKSAGTLRVVIATDQPALTNKLLVTPDSNVAYNLAQVSGTATAVNSGSLTAGTQRVVIATDQPALTNKLLVTPDSNIAVDVARIQGQASVASVAGVIDVMPRKRTGATGLAPSYISGRINTSTTTTIVAATCYLSSLHVCCRQQGAGWAMAIQDGTAAAKVLVNNFILSNAVTGSGNNPLYFSYAEPIVCTTGINVVTVGGTAGNVDYFATYWQ